MGNGCDGAYETREGPASEDEGVTDDGGTDVSSFFVPDTGPWWKARVRPVWRLTLYGMYLVWVPALVAEGARRHGFRWAWVFALVLWFVALYWFRVAWKEERSVR